MLAVLGDGKKSTSSSPSARGTMWHVSRQSSAECPSDMRQKRSMLGGTGKAALAAEMAASLTSFFMVALTESTLTLFTGEIVRARHFCLRLPRADGWSFLSCSGA